MDSKNTEAGYTLITPVSTREILKDLPSNVYLIDMYGQIVHTWSFKKTAFHSYLQKNGNLIVEFQIAGDKGVPGGGDTGLIQEVDWNGNVVREYKNNYLHHDVDILPNGNWGVIVWRELPSKQASLVGGGLEGTEFKGKMYSDAILEVDSNNTIVWEWHVEDHLRPEAESLDITSARSGWTHMNSIKYVAKNPITQTQSYLVSLRNISTVLLINRNDGKIIWRSPKGMLSGQHDATVLDNGNILLFDNGIPGRKSPDLGSRVIEINPKTNKIVWNFDGGQHKLLKAQFDSQRIGGAQRLANGNTLITDGVAGRIFEVTKDKKFVWDYFNSTNRDNEDTFWPFTPVFKARRYQKADIRWPENLPSPFPRRAQMCFD